jgi:hypothetical protein
MRNTIGAVTAVLAFALVGCTSATDDSKAEPPKATKSSKPSADVSEGLKAAGIPPEPTGADRDELLRALAAVNPDIVADEEKAIDAARNQCASINGGAQRLDQSAALRFTYKDVTTTEEQGKQINEALKGLGFCKV